MSPLFLCFHKEIRKEFRAAGERCTRHERVHVQNFEPIAFQAHERTAQLPRNMEIVLSCFEPVDVAHTAIGNHCIIGVVTADEHAVFRAF